MALNWAMIHDDQPVPLPNETTITSVAGADLTVVLPNNRLNGIGKIWLTDQRLVFVPRNDKAANPAFTSLTVPLHSILTTSFNQPVFGANYLSFDVNPSPEGGLTAVTQCELRFKDKAMFEFVSLLEKTRERWIYMRRQEAADELDESLPTYTSTSSTPVPASSSSANRFEARAPDDGPPGYEAGSVWTEPS